MDILNAIHDDFAPIIPLHGRIDDPIMNQRLPFLPPAQLENVAEQGKHRERSVVFSAEGYDAARDLAAPARAVRERQRKEKDDQQAALPISNTIVLFENRGLGRFTTADVQAQLTLRKVAFKKTDKLGTLMEMWKTYDAAGKLLAPAHAAAAAAGAAAVAPAAAVAAEAVGRAAASQAVVDLQGVSAAEVQAPAAAAAAQRKCAICDQFGHRADNKKFHPK